MPIPERPPVAFTILELTEGLLASDHMASPRDISPGTTNYKLLRACIATIASYISFCQGECRACARREDLLINDTHITLRLRREKGKQALKEGHKNMRQIRKADMLRMATTMNTFFKYM